MCPSCLRGSMRPLREVLIEQDLHGTVSSFECASSSRAPRTASSVNVGYARTISGIVMPAASDSKRNAIEIRVPATRGLPPRCSGSATIHFTCEVLLVSLMPFLLRRGQKGASTEEKPPVDARPGGQGRPAEE